MAYPHRIERFQPVAACSSSYPLFSPLGVNEFFGFETLEAVDFTIDQLSHDFGDGNLQPSRFTFSKA